MPISLVYLDTVNYSIYQDSRKKRIKPGFSSKDTQFPFIAKKLK